MKIQENFLNTKPTNGTGLNGYSPHEVGDNHLFTSLDTPMKANASSTITVYYGGKFQNPEKIREFQNYINNG